MLCVCGVLVYVYICSFLFFVVFGYRRRRTMLSKYVNPASVFDDRMQVVFNLRILNSYPDKSSCTPARIAVIYSAEKTYEKKLSYALSSIRKKYLQKLLAKHNTVYSFFRNVLPDVPHTKRSFVRSFVRRGCCYAN